MKKTNTNPKTTKTETATTEKKLQGASRTLIRNTAPLGRFLARLRRAA